MSRARNTSIFPILNNYIKFSESSDRFSHLKIQNPGERFDWSIDRVAFGKPVMWLAVKTCAAVGYVNWDCKVNDKQCVSVSC